MADRGLQLVRQEPLNQIRRVMAQSMKQSVQVSALSQVAREIDLAALWEWRKSLPEDQSVSLNDLFLCAVARTLPNHPLMSAELENDHLNFYAQVNLGMAVAVKEGLVVVVIRDADKKTVAEITQSARELAERARAGRLRLDDITGGTFTVSNLGMFGVDYGFALPRPPEAAILLIGRAREQLALVDGQVTARRMAAFNLTYDHRFIDGRSAAEFLADLQKRVDEPAQLI